MFPKKKAIRPSKWLMLSLFDVILYGNLPSCPAGLVEYKIKIIPRSEQLDSQTSRSKWPLGPLSVKKGKKKCSRSELLFNTIFKIIVSECICSENLMISISVLSKYFKYSAQWLLNDLQTKKRSLKLDGRFLRACAWNGPLCRR